MATPAAPKYPYAELAKNLCLHSGDFGLPDLCAGNMGILRCDMPQMPDAADLINGIDIKDAAGNIIGHGPHPFSQWLVDRNINVVLKKVSPAMLKATQQELEQVKVIGMVDSAVNPASGKAPFQPWSTPGGKGSVQITEDGYILDGHHRWAATMLLIQMGAIPSSTPIDVAVYAGAPGTRPITVANMLAVANIAGDAGKIGHSKCPGYEYEPWGDMNPPALKSSGGFWQCYNGRHLVDVPCKYTAFNFGTMCLSTCADTCAEYPAEQLPAYEYDGRQYPASALPYRCAQ